jgi:hypothetical protein
MRTIVSLIAALGMLAAGATVAAALPAEGTAIARLAKPVDAVVVVKKGKRSKSRATGTPTSPPPQPNQSY